MNFIQTYRETLTNNSTFVGHQRSQSFHFIDGHFSAVTDTCKQTQMQKLYISAQSADFLAELTPP